MKILLSFVATGLAVLAGGTLVQAQHGHGGHGGYSHGGHGGYSHGGHGYGHVVGHNIGHAYSHGGHAVGYGHGVSYGHLYGGYSGIHLHGYTPVYNSYPSYSYPTVVAAPVVQSVAEVAPAPVAGVVTTTSLKPNAIPPYTGPGVTLRLPAEFPGSVYVQVDKREVEIKPGTEVALKDKPSYLVEFDRGGEFGTSSSDVTEGVYKFKVADKGWFLVPDDAAAGGVRRNALPGEPKK